jgi:hypothetical protein
VNLEPFMPLFPGEPVPLVAPLETVPATDVAPVELTGKKRRRVRARDGDGQFVADDPTTPSVDEAWEGGEP